MPFTGSHIAAILPLLGPKFGLGRAGRGSTQGEPTGRWRLAPAALVLGSMAPDIPMYIGLPAQRSFTHTPLAALTVNPIVTLALVGLWMWLVRPVVLWWVPELAGRWRPTTPRPRWITVLSGYLAAALAGLTHLVLDAGTHESGMLTQEFAALRRPVSGVAPYYAAQIALSGLGLAILGLWLRVWLRRTQTKTQLVPGRVRAWVTALGMTVLGGGLLLAIPQSYGIRGVFRWKMLVARWGFLSGTLALLLGIVVIGWGWLGLLRARRLAVLPGRDPDVGPGLGEGLPRVRVREPEGESDVTGGHRQGG